MEAEIIIEKEEAFLPWLRFYVKTKNRILKNDK